MKRRVINTSPASLLLIAFIIASTDAIGSDRIYEVPQLRNPVEIIVDKWGVPHIFAESQRDMFVAQGFNAARDRLWQIDLWRLRGLGLLSSVFGHRYIAQDRANRLFLYRGDMDVEWQSYTKNAQSITSAFTEGINAYLDHLDLNPNDLPPEFQLLEYKPSRWSPEDIVRIRSHGLWRNSTSEVMRSQILCTHGREAAALWKPLRPSWTPMIAPGFDPCSVKQDVLDVYRMAKAPVSFRAHANVSSYTESTASESNIGSNNWVVAPERTRNGSTILANDPHRLYAVPSLRYVAHLNAPGVNLIGAGEPALPGISIGHNDHIAFGLTIFAIDQEDLYYYPVNPSYPNQYQYQGKTEEIRRVTENIDVRNEDTVPITLEFTRHGPVVKRERERIYALRAAWLEPGMAPYFGSVAYMNAHNWTQFRAALRHWGGPPENQVYADIHGNIGYKPAGLFPQRNNHDGLLPVPGNGSYEWNGFFDIDVLPEEFNPNRGFVVTANAFSLPKNYPIDKFRVGFEWSSPWRQQRLVNVIGKQRKHTLHDSLSLQHDYLSLLANKLVQKLPRRLPNNIKQVLKSWRGQMEADSSAAAFFSVWYTRHLVPTLISSLYGESTPIKSLDSSTVLSLVENPNNEHIVTTSLETAFEECVRIMGRRPDRWKWGNIHSIRFEHPLYSIAKGKLKEDMELVAYPRGGSGNTTNSSGFLSKNLQVRSGASWRFAVDTSNWDTARMTNTPGQSGDPESPFYDNLLKGWAKDETFPLLFSRESIETNAALYVELLPKI